jgi:hypothetical protein
MLQRLRRVRRCAGPLSNGQKKRSPIFQEARLFIDFADQRLIAFALSMAINAPPQTITMKGLRGMKRGEVRVIERKKLHHEIAAPDLVFPGRSTSWPSLGPSGLGQRAPAYVPQHRLLAGDMLGLRITPAFLESRRRYLNPAAAFCCAAPLDSARNSCLAPVVQRIP